MGKSIHTKEYEVFLRHLRQARKDAGLKCTAPSL